MRWLPLVLVLALAAGVLPVTARQEVTKPRIGVYESRAIAVAFSASKYNDISGKRAEMDAARKAGDKDKVAELERWGQQRQQKMHFQGFCRVPVDDLLEPVNEGVARIGQDQNLLVITSRCDWNADVELIDVTDALVALYNPSERTLKTIAELRKHKPLPLTEVAGMKD